jgi:hypothetical protein
MSTKSAESARAPTLVGEGSPGPLARPRRAWTNAQCRTIETENGPRTMNEQRASLTGIVERIRQPAYTGENRCVPCTVANVVIGAVAGAIIGVVSVPLGLATVALSLVLIYLRGYLVPYTPTLTKRYFPDRVLAWFDKETPGEAAEATDGDVDEIDIQWTLMDLGVITDCDDREDLCLEQAFGDLWRDHIERVRSRDRESQRAAVVDMLGITGEHEVDEYGRNAVVVTIDGERVGQWESDPALIADVAAEAALREWVDNWESYHVINRSQLLNGLRLFLDRCPQCDAPVSLGQDTVESCCRSYDVAAVSCVECDARLFEMELQDHQPTGAGAEAEA